MKPWSSSTCTDKATKAVQLMPISKKVGKVTGNSEDHFGSSARSVQAKKSEVATADKTENAQTEKFSFPFSSNRTIKIKKE